MAAIIAQLTRAKREREKREKITHVDDCESKCHFTLPEFERRFDPKLHNSYCIRSNFSFVLCLFISILSILDKRKRESEKKKKESLRNFFLN